MFEFVASIIFRNVGIFCAAVLLATEGLAAAKVEQVLISKIVDHPALNKTVEGVVDGLASGGFQLGKDIEIRVESAQGSAVLASQIAAKFVNQHPSVVVGVGTIASQAFIRYVNNCKVKLVFSSVTDPVGASLVKNSQRRNAEVSGVSNYVDIEPQIAIFKALQPHLKALGILYNPGELNSVSIVKKLKEVAPKFGLTIVTQTANSTGEVVQSATKLAGQTDAIFISNDNVALAGIQSIFKVASNAKIPVYVSDTDVVASGAVAALGPNQYKIGLQTGNMVAQVLKGEKLEDMPVQFPNNTELYINLDAANKIGLLVGDDVLSKAVCIISNGKSCNYDTK